MSPTDMSVTGRIWYPTRAAQRPVGGAGAQAPAARDVRGLEGHGRRAAASAVAAATRRQPRRVRRSILTSSPGVAPVTETGSGTPAARVAVGPQPQHAVRCRRRWGEHDDHGQHGRDRARREATSADHGGNVGDP